jgi:uncharacterized membrane protein
MNQEQLIKLGRGLTLAGYFSLMFGLYTWQLVIDPAEKHLISLIIFFQLGPLMLPLFGLLKGKLYTHAWSMYLAIFYFVIGVWYTGHDEQLGIGLYLISTSLLFFTGCVLYTRYMGKKSKAE